MKHSKNLLTKSDWKQNDPSKEDDFSIKSIAAQLGGMRPGYWGVEQAKQFFILARKHSGDYEKMAADMDCPKSRVQLFGQEMKRAAKFGYDNLEQYFEKGRPARYGKTPIKIK